MNGMVRARAASAHSRWERLFASRIFGAALIAAAAYLGFAQIRAAGNIPPYPAALESGMAFYLGAFSPAVSSFMPLLSLSAALASMRLTGNQLFYAVGALNLCSFLIVRRAALRASGPAAANAAGLLLIGAALFASGEGGLDAEQAMLTFLTALFVYFLARKEMMTSGDYALSGLALGLTLLIRSTMLALPFVLAGAFAVLSPERGRAQYKNIALFLLCSYVLLAPWVRLNYSLHGEFIPFEKDRTGYNVVTGVKGALAGMEGDWRRLAGLGPRDSVYRWAAREIARSPADYAFYALKRCGYIMRSHLFLLLAALLALTRTRNRTQLLLLCAGLYFIFMHSLISVVPRYLYPLRYLLAAPAAAFFFHAPARAGGRRDILPQALFAGALAFTLAAEGFVLAYPGRSLANGVSGPEAADGSAGRDWLLRAKIYRELKSAGDAEKLAMIKEYLAIPGHKDRDLDYIYYALSAGPREKLVPPPSGSLPLLWVKALKELDLGDNAAARETKKRLLNAYYNTVFLRDIPSEREVDAENRERRASERARRGTPDERALKVEAELYRSHEGMLQKYMYDSLFYLPAAARCALLLKAETELGVRIDEKALDFIGREGDITGLLSCTAAAKLRGGGRAGDYAGAGFPLSAVFGAMDAAFRDGDRDFIAELLRTDPGPEAEKTDLFAAAGEKAGRRELPGYLLSSSGPARKSLFRYFFAYGFLPPKDRATFLKEAGAAAEKNPEQLYAVALRLGKNGERATSKRLSAFLLNAGYFDYAQKRRRLLLLMQENGDYTAALAVADRLVRENPSAEAYNDRGVLLRYLNRPGEAAKDLEKAAALDPGLTDAAINLASVHKLLKLKKQACGPPRPEDPARFAAAVLARNCGAEKSR